MSLNPFIQVVSMLPYSLRLQQRLFGADLKADLDDHQIFPYARLFKGRRGGREEERKIEIKRRRGGGVTQCRGRRMRVGGEEGVVREKKGEKRREGVDGGGKEGKRKEKEEKGRRGRTGEGRRKKKKKGGKGGLRKKEKKC